MSEATTPPRSRNGVRLPSGDTPGPKSSWAGERDREALLLWDAGLDYGEIAGALEISTGSVGTTLARARERLVKAHREREQDDVAHQ